MRMPENSIAVMGGPGTHPRTVQYEMIDTGRILLIFKVLDTLTSSDDPGPYQAPPGTVTHLTTREDSGEMALYSDELPCRPSIRRP